MSARCFGGRCVNAPWPRNCTLPRICPNSRSTPNSGRCWGLPEVVLIYRVGRGMIFNNRFGCRVVKSRTKHRPRLIDDGNMIKSSDCHWTSWLGLSQLLLHPATVTWGKIISCFTKSLSCRSQILIWVSNSLRCHLHRVCIHLSLHYPGFH